MITEILSKVLPVLVMIALGRLCETKQIIDDEQHAGLKAIVSDILLPVVLFQAFFTADYGKRHWRLAMRCAGSSSRMTASCRC